LLQWTDPSNSVEWISGSFIALTVDGRIATPDGGVEFLDKFHPDPNAPPRQDDNDEDELGFVAFMRTVDCLVMDRKPFEKVLELWKRNVGLW
jgi:hypothetical protein